MLNELFNQQCNHTYMFVRHLLLKVEEDLVAAYNYQVGTARKNLEELSRPLLAAAKERAKDAPEGSPVSSAISLLVEQYNVASSE